MGHDCGIRTFCKKNLFESLADANKSLNYLLTYPCGAKKWAFIKDVIHPELKLGDRVSWLWCIFRAVSASSTLAVQ